MQFNGYTDFRDFLQKVRLNAQFENSLVDFRDLAYFAPELGNIPNRFTLSGKLDGTVSGFTVDNLNLITPRGGSIEGWLSFNGLPDVEETFIDGRIENLRMKPTEFQEFFPFIGFPPEIYRLGKIYFEGNYTGFYYDFVAHGNLQTGLGGVRSDLQLSLQEQNSYRGQLAMQQFDLGRLIDNQQLGTITFQSTLQGSGFDLKAVNAVLEADIQQAEINHYVYRDVQVDGKIDKKLFEGKVAVNDENLALDFDGKIDFNQPLPVFDFRAQLAHADFKALNFAEYPYQVQTNAFFNFKGNSLDNIEGQIALNNTTIQREEKSISTDTVTFQSHIIDEQRQVSLQSDYVDGQMKGNYNWYELPMVFSSFFDRYIPQINQTFSLVAYDDSITVPPAQFDFNVHWKQDKGLLAVLAPELNIPENSTIRGHFDGKRDSMFVKSDIPVFRWENYEVRKLALTGQSRGHDRLNFRFRAGSLWKQAS
jgi:hypothetical protein